MITYPKRFCASANYFYIGHAPTLTVDEGAPWQAPRCHHHHQPRAPRTCFCCAGFFLPFLASDIFSSGDRRPHSAVGYERAASRAGRVTPACDAPTSPCATFLSWRKSEGGRTPNQDAFPGQRGAAKRLRKKSFSVRWLISVLPPRSFTTF
eukprot:SAG11_NODE_3924_length_2146_cov_9.609673_2_plen_151_part_00